MANAKCFQRNPISRENQTGVAPAAELGSTRTHEVLYLVKGKLFDDVMCLFYKFLVEHPNKKNHNYGQRLLVG